MGNPSSVPGLGRSPGKWQTTQYCHGDSMDRGACFRLQKPMPEVKSWTRQATSTFLSYWIICFKWVNVADISIRLLDTVEAAVVVVVVGSVWWGDTGEKGKMRWLRHLIYLNPCTAKSGTTDFLWIFFFLLLLVELHSPMANTDLYT